MQTERDKLRDEAAEIYSAVKYEELACSILEGVEFKDETAIGKAICQLAKYLEEQQFSISDSDIEKAFQAGRTFVDAEDSELRKISPTLDKLKYKNYEDYKNRK
jgi:hypothetical protein